LGWSGVSGTKEREVSSPDFGLVRRFVAFSPERFRYSTDDVVRNGAVIWGICVKDAAQAGASLPGGRMLLA
jgi:hypothetical protein